MATLRNYLHTRLEKESDKKKNATNAIMSAKLAGPLATILGNQLKELQRNPKNPGKKLQKMMEKNRSTHGFNVRTVK